MEIEIPPSPQRKAMSSLAARSKRSLAALLMVLPISAEGGPLPEHISEPESQCPAGEYFHAVGVSKGGEKAARESARSRLLELLGAALAVETGSKLVPANAEDFVHLVADMGEVAKNKRMHHALACLPRQQAAAVVKARTNGQMEVFQMSFSSALSAKRNRDLQKFWHHYNEARSDALDLAPLFLQLETLLGEPSEAEQGVSERLERLDASYARMLGNINISLSRGSHREVGFERDSRGVRAELASVEKLPRPILDTYLSAFGSMGVKVEEGPPDCEDSYSHIAQMDLLTECDWAGEGYSCVPTLTVNWTECSNGNASNLDITPRKQSGSVPLRGQDYYEEQVARQKLVERFAEESLSGLDGIHLNSLYAALTQQIPLLPLEELLLASP
jgi:hypothetical protein